MLRNPSINPLSTLVRFVASGGAATALHWATMSLLIQFGVPATAATAAGATSGVVANYLLQFHHTFGARAQHRRAIPRYLAASVAGWLANLLIFDLLHNRLAVDTAAAQGLTSLGMAIANFFLYQRMVFHERTPVIDSAPSHPA